MDRHAFLSKLRARLVAGAPESIPHPVPPLDDVPELAYTVDLSDPVEAFTRKASGALAKVVRITDADDGRALLAEAVETFGVELAVVSDDPECEGVTDALRELGAEVVGIADRDRHADADLGITGAAYGIAATGTIVADSARAGGRSASLVPPAHLALVRADAIVPTAGDVFRELAARYPDGPPSQLVCITGPSRSADIELTLTMGVHGPKAVWVGIVG